MDQEKSQTKKKQYDIQYAKEKLKRIPLDVPKTTYEAIKAHTDSQGESVNGFIKRAIASQMERDQVSVEAPEPPQSKDISLPFDGLKAVPAAFSGVTETTDAIPEASRKLIEEVRKMTADNGGANYE